MMRAWLLLLLVIGTAGTSDAHRAPGTMTSIAWNDNSGNTEIVHRVHSHDAELGVGRATGQTALSVAAVKDRARIALYVESRFAVLQNGEPLPLELVGAEVAGDFVLVYQEMPGRLEGSYTVQNQILLDVIPGQVNEVVLAGNSLTRTLQFDARTRSHGVQL